MAAYPPSLKHLCQPMYRNWFSQGALSRKKKAIQQSFLFFSWTLQLAQRLLFDMTVYGHFKHFKQETVQMIFCCFAAPIPAQEKKSLSFFLAEYVS